MNENYSDYIKTLKTSLKHQYKSAQKQLILNPVENIPDLNYVELGYNFLYGIYNSDKLRSENEMIDTKIQFASRNYVAKDINKIYELWCKIMKAEAISMRFFSGLHAHTTIFMAITRINDNVIILPEKAGGHMATKAIFERLGLNVYEFEIDFENKRINIEKSKRLIEKVKPKVIFVDRSEGTLYEDFSWLSEYKNIYKIFDASQYLTNILVGDYISPFDMGFDAILSTTHKNFPGPQRALYCSKRKDEMWNKIQSKIGSYVSNMHPYSIYSLGLMLEDYKKYEALSKNMIENATELEKELINCGINIITQFPQHMSEMRTHHIWIQCESKREAFDLYNRWERNGFLTNYRLLPYNIGYGIRMGLSAATVCGLTKDDVPLLARLLAKSYISNEYNPALHDEIESFIIHIKERTNA